MKPEPSPSIPLIPSHFDGESDRPRVRSCLRFQVSGFPTLNIYVDGKKAEEYSGKRELDLLSEFVEKHLAGEKAKDEL